MESIVTREREEAMWTLNALPKGTIATAGRELRDLTPEVNALPTSLVIELYVGKAYKRWQQVDEWLHNI